jgi:hypothetical protein
MDFLRRIGRFIGGAAQNVGRAFQQAPQVVSRAVQDAQRAQQQAVQQVQRNLPRFQAPPPPRIQLPQIQIPRVQLPQIQLPQAPRVDLGAVSRALQGVGQGLDIVKRNTFGQQLTPQQQRLVALSPQLQSQMRMTKALQPTGQDITKLLRASAPAVDIGLSLKEKGLGAFSSQERMQRGLIPAIQQQTTRTLQKLMSTPEGQQLQRMPGIQGQIGRAAQTAAFKPEQAIKTSLQTGVKTFREIPGIKQLSQTKVGKIANEFLFDPTINTLITNLGRVGGAQAGQKTYAKGLQGEMQNLSDVINIGSLVYSGGLSGQLATKGTPFFQTAAKLAPRLFASGTGQDLITQLSEGKKPNELDWKRALMAGGAYTTLGIGIPGATRGGSAAVSKLFGTSTASKIAQAAAGAPFAKTTQAVPGVPVTKAAQTGPTPNYVTVFRAGEKGRVGDNYFASNPAFAQNVKKDLIAEGTKPQIISRRINTNDYLDIRNPAQRTQLEDLLGPQKVQELLNAGSNGLPAVVVGKGQLKGYVGDEIMLRSAANRLGFKGIQISEGKDMISKYPNLEGVTFAKAIPQAKIKVAKEVTGITPTMTKPIYETVPKSAMEPKQPKSFDELIKTGQISKKEAKQVQALGMTPKDYLEMKVGPTKLMPPAELGQPLTAMQQVPEGMKKAQFSNQLEFDAGVPNEVLTNIFPGYKPLANDVVYKNATEALNKNQAQIVQDLISRKLAPTAETNAQAMIAMRRLIDAEDFKTATKLAQATIAQGTDAGRAVQIFSRWRATTPEGALIKANKVINEVNAKLPMNKKIELGRDKVLKIQDIANKIQQLGEGTRERQVQEALLAKEIMDIVPPGKLRKISTLQTMAQLLNAKTAIRNVLGNTAAGISNDVSNFVGSGVDAALFKLGLIKQRSVVMPSLTAGIKGFVKGAKYGAQDVKLGIKTSGAAGSYDIQPQIFKNEVLRKLENAMGYELSVPDKAFYQRAFDVSLDNQMRAAAKSGVKVNKPTAQMIGQANEEGLYQTFQNNSGLANALVQVKHWMNAGKDFGVGDFVLKYPKTPGNIVAQGIDFTPWGIYKGTRQLVDAARTATMNPITQRQGILNIGRGLTGTGLISLGAVLAGTGIMTADKNANKNVNALQTLEGSGPFTINISGLERFATGGDPTKKIGDLVVNYDWLQPNAIQLSMGANMVLAPKQKNKIGEFLDNAISSTNSAVNTVVEQPVLQGVSRILSKAAGGSIGKSDIVGAIADTVASAPSSFIPSLLNQVGQMTDKFARETRTTNFVQEVANKVKQRVPGLRQGLPIKYTTLGTPAFQFDPAAGGNNIFNVFMNPSFPRTVKDTVATQLIDDLYNKTGSAEQFPKQVGDKVSLSINGKQQQLGLNSQQISDYQKYVGERTNQAFTQLANDPAFQALSPEEQTNRMSNIMENINSAAKIQLFGNQPKTKSYAVETILQGGDPTTTGGKPKVAKVKVSKARRARVARGRRGGGRGRVAKVKVPRIKTPRVTVKGLPSVPTVKAKKLSFKVPKPKAGPRKTVKIKQG